MPELMELYQLHKESRDKFEVIAIHDSSVKSMKELKEKIEPLKKHWWQGRDIPFPVVIDREKKTQKRYEVQGWPTSLLIDPKGNLVGFSYSKGRTFGLLEDQLPEVPQTSRLSSAYDRRPNVYFEQLKRCTVAEVAKRIKNCWGVEIEVNEKFSKETGLDSGMELTSLYVAVGISLRSYEQIELHPNGLEIATSPYDPTKLVLRTRDPKSKKSKLSKVQRIIEETLKALVSKKENKSGKEKVVQIKNLNLPELVLRVSRVVDDLNIAVGKSVLSDTDFDLEEAKFSGKMDLYNVGESLNKILDQHNLRAKVRGEFLMIEKNVP